MHNRFFINSKYSDNIFDLSKTDFHHIKNVLRLKPKNQIEVAWIDKIFICDIISFNKESVSVKPVRHFKDIRINKPIITLLQSIPKLNKMDNLLEKCTELGIHKIIPVYTERVEKKKISENIYSRWNNIILSAAKQSKRDYIPELIQPVSINEALNIINSNALKILFYEISDYNINNLTYKNEEEIVYFIGPEGSITSEEYQKLKNNNFIELKLNLPILKVDTAAITALVTILNFTNRI